MAPNLGINENRRKFRQSEKNLTELYGRGKEYRLQITMITVGNKNGNKCLVSLSNEQLSSDRPLYHSKINLMFCAGATGTAETAGTTLSIYHSYKIHDIYCFKKITTFPSFPFAHINRQPFRSIMTCTSVCKGWIKHATLINNCYPVGPEEKGPRSNELSYLIFYANSKPAKLTKCGVYLDKRVSTDVRKRRKQDTDISLQIIKALLEECNSNLNLFSKNVLKIISASLSANDIDVITRAASVFITFCSYHDGSTLGVDVEFTQIYEDLISSFAQYAMCKDHDTTIERRYRSIGLHALRAAATSNALYTTNARTQLQHIIPAILYNLTDGLEALQEADLNPVNDEPIPQSRRFSLSVTTISLEENTNLAYHCLKELFEKSDPSNVHYSLEPTFKFLDENDMWTPSSFGISLVLMILSSLQQQCRHILASNITRQLETLPEGSISMQKKLTLVEMLSSILTNKLALVGLSTLEVLDVLLQLLLGSLKNGEGNDNESKALISKKLIDCIGGLATHIYYENQICDIMEHIITHLRLQPDVPDSSQQGDISISDGIPLSDLRKTLLKCLDVVVQMSKTVYQKIGKITICETPVEIFLDTISLCMDGDLDVRISYAKVLSAFLNNEGMPEEQKDTDSTQLTYFNQPAIHFLNTLHLSLYQYALSDIAQPADHVAMLTLLRALLVRFRADQIIRGIPVVFKLQSEAKEEKLKNYAHQRALASVIALYFSDIATVLNIPELREYIEKASPQLLCDSRILDSFLASSENNLDNIDSFKPSEGEIPNGDDHSLQPIDIWLDRQIIVSMLSQHKEFSGIDGKKLEVDLMAEWKPEEGFEKVKKERYRIKSSRIVEKPQIAITSFIMSLEDSSGELPKIKVENLKDALELNVTQLDHVKIDNKNNRVLIEFTPTIPHCSMATLIGLCIRVRLLRSLPERFKVDIMVRKGTHQSEQAVNKQLNDKERVAAALENSHLLEVVNLCLSTAGFRGETIVR
ncbi:16287_t:CDS:10 [Acaulospora morrowiae]|uniref:16287_t:CDS:1 n=1 Tax=Acaulospora morrowiae TaxID=94023 RepID=A0A9N9CIY2_9GLOM|nr:16287_t:CDS:10 [Acaulospora morrowiae]